MKMNNNLREAAQQALEALGMVDRADDDRDLLMNYECVHLVDAITALRAALAEQPSNKGSNMPITDDHGKAIRRQYRVIEQRGKWTLLYDQHVLGNTVQHEFRVQKLQHDIVLYQGITLAEAQKRFIEKVEADNE